MLYLRCCQLNYEVDVIGLNPRLVRRTASLYLSALCATVDDDVALLGIEVNVHRLHKSQAFTRSVPGVFVNMN